MELIIDNQTDFTLRQQHRGDYMTVQKNRHDRKTVALHNHLQLNFPNEPLASLQELEKSKTTFQTLLDNSAGRSAEEIDRLNKLVEHFTTKISNNEYYLENSPEHQYRLNYDSAVSSFIWPTQEELTIREQEKSQLLALLNGN